MTELMQQPAVNLDAEEYVLSAMMLSSVACEVVSRELDPAHFYRESHAKIYRAALSLHQLGEPVDSITIADRLEELGQLQDIGGTDRVNELVGHAPATANVLHHARIIIREARRRQLEKIGERIVTGVHESADPADIHAAALDELTALQDQTETTAEPIVFETIRKFLTRPLPQSESLIGVTRDGTNLLPRYGWVMPWGREGSGKTSVLVDLLFHAAAGDNWLQYHVARPLKFVIVINEGVPGGLQDKIRQKVELWNESTVDQVIDNIAIYVSPWGEFTFKNRQAARHGRDYALDFQADYVVFDPLHTLGTIGAGTPQETEEFKNVLRRFGMWNDIGVITAHHSNKNGMVSGDWARHPDTVIRLEKDGKNPATKIVIEKARPADPHELGVPQLLEWIPDTMGYRRVQIDAHEKVPDTDLLARIHNVLEEASEPFTMQGLQAAVEGEDKRIAAIAKAEIEAGRIHNISTHKGRYRLTVKATDLAQTLDSYSASEPRRVAHEDSPDLLGADRTQSSADKIEGDAQTRTDTENLLGVQPTQSRTDNTASPDGGLVLGVTPLPVREGGTSREQTTGRLHEQEQWIDQEGWMLARAPLTEQLLHRWPTLGIGDIKPLLTRAANRARDEGAAADGEVASATDEKKGA